MSFDEQRQPGPAVTHPHPAVRSPSLAYVTAHFEDDVSATPALIEVDEDGEVDDQPSGGDEGKDEKDEKVESWGEVISMVALFVVLGASGWWSNNTINNENPVFINKTPEGNRFPTLGSFACQIGNVFPIVFKSVTGFCLTERTRRKIVAPTVYVGLFSGALILAVCAFFWQEKVIIGGSEYSGVLLLCCVISGGIGCMSNVTYWAFASRYPVYCTKAMSTGMTFGGLLGSAIILGQNAGCNPTFSAEYYFLAGVAIQLVMLVGTLPILRFSEEGVAKGHLQAETEDESERTPLLRPTKVMLSVNSDAEDSDTDDPLVGTAVAKMHDAQPSYINRDGFILCCICFAVYGMTYALAPMMPYVLEGYEAKISNIINNSTAFVNHSLGSQHLMLYTEDGGVTDPSLWYLGYGNGTHSKTNSCNASDSSNRDGIYRWALVCQQVGDVSGRISTAFGTPTQLSTLIGLGSAACSIFLLFCVMTAMSASVPIWLPGEYGYVIPALLLVYYFLRGFCVTSSYVWVKVNMSQRDAERLSSNLGMLGQLGALSGNVIMVILTYFVLQPP